VVQGAILVLRRLVLLVAVAVVTNQTLQQLVVLVVEHLTLIQRALMAHQGKELRAAILTEVQVAVAAVHLLLVQIHQATTAQQAVLALLILVKLLQVAAVVVQQILVALLEA
jgi:hypothetical protein